MKKKILIIWYWWTIVMVVNEEKKIVEPAKNLDEILALLPRVDELADIELEILANKDSANITPNDWTRLAMHIHGKHGDYDAFIIAHGTNTMANTASALSLALWQWLKKPVIVTWSQLPLSVYWNDARFNFENAIKVAVEASENNIAEVMISFNDVVLRGCRALKISESKFHAFDSPAFPALWEITSTWVHFRHWAKKVSPEIPFTISPHFNNNILSMDITPGLSPSLLESLVLSWKCKWVVLKSFWAWSVPTEWEFSLLPLIKKLTQEFKIPVIITTKFLWWNAFKEINDECAVLAIDHGAIPGGDLTSVMAEVKLMRILAQWTFSENTIRDMMLDSVVWEISDARDQQY